MADGSEANFNTYATELIARQLSGDFHPARSVYFVAAPGWTQDTLNTACQNDPNAVGGLVVKFTSFEVEANWLAFNTESEHITPTLFLVGCHGPFAYVATPPLNIYTIKSKTQWTVPIAPLTALGALFTYKGNAMGAVQTNLDTLVIITAASALSGNFGYLSQGKEALSAAQQLMQDASAFTGFVCNGHFVGRYQYSEPLSATDPGTFNDAPTDLQNVPVQNKLKLVFSSLRRTQNADFSNLYGPYATPSPAPSASPGSVGTQAIPRTSNLLAIPPPDAGNGATPNPDVLAGEPSDARQAPLESICSSLGNPQDIDESQI